MPPFARLLPRAAASAAIVTLLAACGDVVEPVDAPPPIREYVTPEVAAQLTPEGRFRIDDGPLPTEAPAIDARRAGEQALAYVRTFAPHLGEYWERSHGGRIDFSRLEVDPRIFLARSPYGPVPDGPFHSAHRRAWGPFYIVRLTSANRPAVVVAVSVFNTDVEVERGRVILHPFGGNEFFVTGLSLDARKAVFGSPEHAVNSAGRRLGARVSRAPVLAARGRDGDWSPDAPLWRLSLEREVPLRGKSRAFRQRVREVYVGPLERLYVPAPDQPSTQSDHFITGPPWPGPVVRVEIPVLPGSTVHYEEVVPDADAAGAP